MENGEFVKGTISDGTIMVFVCGGDGGCGQIKPQRREERLLVLHYLDNTQVCFCDCSCIVGRAELTSSPCYCQC